MRLLLLCPHYRDETSGVARYVRDLARGLADRNHSVTVLSTDPSRGPESTIEEGVITHTGGGVRIPGIGRLLRSAAAGTRVNYALSNLSEARRLDVVFDVVEAPSWGAGSLLMSLIRWRPVVVNVVTLYESVAAFTNTEKSKGDRIAKKLERAAISRADIVVAPSELTAGRIDGLFGAGDRVKVIPLPTDFDFWSGSAGFSREAIVLVVGRLERRKAPELAIEALAKIRNSVPGAEVVYVGPSTEKRDGTPYNEWLRQLALKTGVICRLEGEVTRKELQRWYERARVVVVPSHDESFGLTAIEALAAGRPVVCTGGTGAAKSIERFGGGTVVSPNDPASLGAALRDYLDYAEWAAEVGTRGRRAAEAVCSPTAVAESREAVYCETVHSWRESQASSARYFPSAAPSVRALAPSWFKTVAHEVTQDPWKHLYFRGAEQLFELITTYRPDLRTGMKDVWVLDLACTPHISTALAEGGAKVVLVDIVRGELEKARNLANALGIQDRVHLVVADALRPPFRRGVFDVVWNFGFIEHFDDPVGVIREMVRPLKEAGAACVIVPSKWTLHSLWTRRRQRRSSEGYFWDWIGKERSYSSRDLNHTLKSAGLHPIAHSHVGIKRAILDEIHVQFVLGRAGLRILLYKLINATDAVERSLPGIRRLGFLVGAIGAINATHEVRSEVPGADATAPCHEGEL